MSRSKPQIENWQPKSAKLDTWQVSAVVGEMGVESEFPNIVYKVDVERNAIYALNIKTKQSIGMYADEVRDFAREIVEIADLYLRR